MALEKEKTIYNPAICLAFNQSQSGSVPFFVASLAALFHPKKKITIYKKLLSVRVKRDFFYSYLVILLLVIQINDKQIFCVFSSSFYCANVNMLDYQVYEKFLYGG